MNNVRILAVLAVVLLVIFVYQRKSVSVPKKTMSNPTSVPSQKPTVKQSNELAPTGVQSTNEQAPSAPSASQHQQDTSLKYPGSLIIRSSEATMELESSDDPKTITNWYKEKIKAMNFNVNTVVQTSANNTILNKLVASNGKKEVRVEISKKAGDSVVKISVTQ